MVSVALGFYSYASEAAAKEGTGGEGDEGRQTLKLWVSVGHFNHSMYAFISFINGGSAENCSCADGGNMLETTGLLNTDIQGKFSLLRILCFPFFLILEAAFP